MILLPLGSRLPALHGFIFFFPQYFLLLRLCRLHLKFFLLLFVSRIIYNRLTTTITHISSISAHHVSYST